MKTQHFVPLLSLLLLTACPDKSGKTTGSAQPPLKVVICQPDKTEVVAMVMAALKESLQKQVWAKRRGLELKILQPNGETLSVPAPAADGFMVKLFGANTPAARQQKLDTYLAVLETKLKTGCTGQTMNLTTLKALPETLYTTEDFVVWSAGGDGKNPWMGQKKLPLAWVLDAAALEATLDETPAQNLLVLTAPVAMPVAKAAKKPTAKVAQKAKPKPTPAVSSKETSVQASAVPAPSQGSTVVLNMGAPSRDSLPTSSSQSQAMIDLDHSEMFGTISHDVGESAPNDKNLVRKICDMIKAEKERFDFQVVLISRADQQKGSTKDRNQQLSEQRARICKAALIQQGIPVQECFCIGDALAEGTPDADRDTQIFLVNKVAKKGADANKTASR